jgi:hypothetical protein
MRDEGRGARGEAGDKAISAKAKKKRLMKKNQN